MAKGADTRARLLDAALELFAAKGYPATTTAEIEGAAGLSPGAGGMYRHFPSKASLIHAAVQDQLSGVAALEAAQALLPLGDLRAELTLLARGALAGISQSRKVLSIIESERHELNEERSAAWDNMLQRSYRAAGELLSHILVSHGRTPPEDPRALAVVAIGSLANYVRERDLYGSEPGSIDEERLISAWVGTWMAVAESCATQPPVQEQGAS